MGEQVKTVVCARVTSELIKLFGQRKNLRKKSSTSFARIVQRKYSVIRKNVLFTLSFMLSVFNLTNGIDVKETEERIAAYKKENEDLIKKNKSKLVHCTYYFTCLLLD